MSFNPVAPSFDDGFGASADGDDAYWDPSQLDNDTMGSPSLPSPGPSSPPSAAFIPPPPVAVTAPPVAAPPVLEPPPPSVSSRPPPGPSAHSPRSPPNLPPSSGQSPRSGPIVPGMRPNPNVAPPNVIKPAPFATRTPIAGPGPAPPAMPKPTGSVTPPSSPHPGPKDIAPPAMSAGAGRPPPMLAGGNPNVVQELQKRQDMMRKQFRPPGQSSMPAGAGVPRQDSQPDPVPKTWTDFKENKDFVKLLAGNEMEDRAREQRGNLGSAKPLNVLVCGTSSSNKSVWLTNFLGLLCVRQPCNDVFHARFKDEGQMYVLDFAETDQMYASSEYMYRWADAYVLVYDVGSRDSFESVKDIYRGIMEERGTVYVPIILVANHSATQTEDSWIIPRSEAVTLSDTLSIPFCVCSTPEEVHKSVQTLTQEVRKKDKKRAEGVNTDSRSVTRKEVNEFEIVLLGDAFVGKTTFMNRVFDRKFESSYISTTSKVIRKDQVVIQGEKCMLKIVDTPWFSAAQQAAKVSSGMEGGTGNQKGVMGASAMATIEWLKQQQLLQAQSFFVLFSVTNRESFILAQELVSQLQSALHYAPKSTNKVIFLIGTKTDQVHSTVVTPLEVFQNAERLGVLSTTMSLKDRSQDAIEVIFERLITGLRYHSDALTFKETTELDRQGTLVRGKGRGKQKQYATIHNGMLTMNHSDKDEDQFPIDENSLLESFHSAPDPKGQLYLHFVTGDKQKELWIACSNAAERDAWEECLRKNIIVAQIAHMIAESYVKRAIHEMVHDDLRKRPPRELASIDQALSTEHFSSPGKSYMFIEPVKVARVSAKEAKKLEKEQEKEKKKAEKEQKEREKAEKKAEKKK